MTPVRSREQESDMVVPDKSATPAPRTGVVAGSAQPWWFPSSSTDAGLGREKRVFSRGYGGCDCRQLSRLFGAGFAHRRAGSDGRLSPAKPLPRLFFGWQASYDRLDDAAMSCPTVAIAGDFPCRDHRDAVLRLEPAM